MSKQTGYTDEGKLRIELRGLAVVSDGCRHSAPRDRPAHEAKGDYVCYRECDDNEYKNVQNPAVPANLDVLYEAIIEAEQRQLGARRRGYPEHASGKQRSHGSW
jgi:hypothetical protein